MVSWSMGARVDMTPTYRPNDWQDEPLTRDEWLTLIAWFLPPVVLLVALVAGILEWLY